MRDLIPKRVNKFECGIVNLDSFDGKGTHWVCYYKIDKIKYYFDSYGRIEDKPPLELMKYLGEDNLYYNDSQIQYNNDPPICGHLCVYVLKELSKNIKFQSIINKLLYNKYDFIKYF